MIAIARGCGRVLHELRALRMHAAYVRYVDALAAERGAAMNRPRLVHDLLICLTALVLGASAAVLKDVNFRFRRPRRPVSPELLDTATVEEPSPGPVSTPDPDQAPGRDWVGGPGFSADAGGGPDQ